MKRGCTLLELLVGIGIIALLCALLLPVVCRVYKSARNRIAWTTYWHNNRMEVFLRDSSTPAALLWVATNTPDSAYKSLWSTNLKDVAVPAYRP